MSTKKARMSRFLVLSATQSNGFYKRRNALLSRILSILFPPRLPGKIRDWDERVEPRIEEQGWAGNVQEHYRDAIQRHWAESAPPYRAHWGSPEYRAQLRNAEETMLEWEKELIAQGYINTIHDCWERPDETA
jgi:hypothetical protein